MLGRRDVSFSKKGSNFVNITYEIKTCSRDLVMQLFVLCCWRDWKSKGEIMTLIELKEELFVVTVSSFLVIYSFLVEP